MLSPYRVLDLTDEKGLLCGKLLGDLGADVIKVERPGGDPARNIGPFYHDEVNPEKSLFWWAFNTSKRGITLDIETADGQETFKKLLRTADFVIESFPPGYLDKLGLGYSALGKVNPGIIMVSITPFGQEGPYRDFKTADIVSWAMGGMMCQYGDADRPPVRISHHSQAYCYASAEAAVGAMLALHHRKITGEGQQVDVSIQECVVYATFGLTSYWDIMKTNWQRGQGLGPGVNMTVMWPCKDGHIIWLYRTGPNARRWNTPIVEWMDSEGMATDFLKKFDWETFDWLVITQETIDKLEEPTRRFCMRHTKAELLKGAVERSAMLFPVSTAADIRKCVQLAARKFWSEVGHPELGTSITYPGAFARALEAAPRVSSRAPLIGEHNQEVLDKELSLSKEELLVLRQVKDCPATLPIKKPEQKPKKLLEGIRVADFGWAGVGPLVTKCLSDYGAEVIKIESSTRPCLMRTAGPYRDSVPGLNRGGVFNQWNTGKLSVAINLSNPKGVELAKKLVATADIVVENYAGGVMKRMGLGYEELKKVKSDIIMLSSCMQGQTGPHSVQPGFGDMPTALAGFNHITGWPDRDPVWLSAYTDWVAPLFNTIILLTALDYHQRTGKGQYIDASQYENGVHFIAPLILDYVVNQRVADRVGNQHPDAAPHGVYHCRGEDRWCAIAVFTDEEWKHFKQVIGNPEWTDNPKFSTLPARKENEEELNRLVEEWTINYSPEEVMSMMQASNVSAGVRENGEDLLEHDPQLKHRNYFHELTHPEIGKYRAPRPSFMLSKSPCHMQRAPLLGEYNEYVLKEIINISDEEIAELIIEGVIQ